MGRPTVAYLETVTQSAEGSGKHVRMAHDYGEYARVWLAIMDRRPVRGRSLTPGILVELRFRASMPPSARRSLRCRKPPPAGAARR